MDKRIFILGAGSSIGHSNGLFPTIDKFFAVAKKLGLNRNDFKALEEYSSKLIGKQVFDARTRINIEDLFTHIEIEIERTSSWEVLAIRQQLLKLIREVLIKLQNQTENQEGEYNLLESIRQSKDTIITFNWDLLLDNILNREQYLSDRYTKEKMEKIAKAGPYWEFIIKLSALGEQTIGRAVFDSPYDFWNPDIGYYLKVHGSVDWFFCSNDTCRASRKVFPLLEPTREHFCSECHELMGSLLIPPVLNKEYRQYPLIRRIWNLAAKEIWSANEIIIWGYSLPPTDFYSLWLLREARGENIQKIILINPEVLSIYQRKPIINRTSIRKFYNIFRRVLPRKNISFYELFDDFNRDVNVFKKYNLGNIEDVYSGI
jgi:hypothetical protein